MPKDTMTVAPPRIAGTITCRSTVSVTWVDLWPTVSLTDITLSEKWRRR